MRKAISFFVLMILVLLSSCDGYQQTSVSTDYISSLNSIIDEAHQQGAAWTLSPEEITRHLFPPVSQDSGPKLYEIKKKTISTTECIITVTEEGAIDDEVSGERHNLFFQTNEKGWKITNLKHEIKRRD